VNANGDKSRFAVFGAPVIPDTIGGAPGPLAGILTGLEWAALAHPGARDIVTVAADSPFLPFDLVTRLLDARERAGAEIAIAASVGRKHPVVGLWPVILAPALRHAIMSERVRRVGDFAAQRGAAIAAFSAAKFDPFHNVNTADDLNEAERLARSL
jgi:molybdopterin-guanine dinucleotide biosynthesis protein A